MASDIPEGLAIDTVWAVEASYAPDAAERRVPVRAEHLRHMAALRHAGTILEVGGYLDMSGSLALIRAADEAAAVAVLQDDVYFRSGVWTGFRVRKLGRVVRTEELSAR